MNKNITLSAQEIADLLAGTVEGDLSVTVNNIAKIQEAKNGDLSFLANPKYTHYIYETQASVILVNKDFEPTAPINKTLVRVDDSYSSFARLLKHFNKARLDVAGLSENACIAKSAKIGKNVYVGNFTVIGENVVIADNTKIFHNVTIHDDCKIGSDTVIYSGVTIYPDCIVGNKNIIHGNAVIGCDGFGFAPQKDGGWLKIEQTGNVVLGNDVEVGSCVTLDRATMGSTVIKDGVKINDLIQIGHNVELGENTIIAGQSGVAGSTKVGKNVQIGGQVGVAGHITIGDGARIFAKAGVSTSVKPGASMMGVPAMPDKDYKISHVYFKNIKKLVDRIEQLEKTIKELTKDN